MSGLFGKPPKQKLPEVTPLAPSPKAESAGISAFEELKRKRAKAQGRSSTILSGLSDSNNASFTSLLGG